MIRSCLLIAFLLVPFALRAETLVVRSGEHADFSRLVFQFDQIPEWQFGRFAEGYEMRLPPDFDLDVSQVFQRMPRTRIADVTAPAAGRLNLKMACDCKLDLFELPGGRLVLDVKSAPPDPNSPYENPLPSGSENNAGNARSPSEPLGNSGAVAEAQGSRQFRNPTTIAPWPTGLGFAPATQVDQSVAEVESLPAQALPDLTKEDPMATAVIANDADAQADIIADVAKTHPKLENHAQQTAPTSIENPQAQLELNPIERARAARLARDLLLADPSGQNFMPKANQVLPPVTTSRISEQTLLAQLQRAAAQGLIEVSTPVDDSLQGQGPQTDSEMMAAAEFPEPSPSPKSNPALADHIETRTAVDEAENERLKQRILTLDGETCMDGELFDVADWGRDPKSSGEGGVLGEFDRPNPANVLSAARHYIYLGYGAETLAFLSAFDASGTEAELLREMAAVVDEMPGRELPLLQSQISCATPATMWAVLAHGEIPAGVQADSKAVLFNFSGLPIHLRELFGPRLAKIYLSENDVDTATAIRNQLQRTEVANPESLELVNARINASIGHESQAIEQMQSVIAADIPASPEALVELIESQLKNGEQVSTSNAHLADAMAVEHRGTPLGKQLTKTAIRALAVSGNVDITFERIMLALQNGDLEEFEAEALQADAHIKNAMISNDEIFLKLAFGFPIDGSHQSETSKQARREMASRLLKLGLPENAAAIVHENDPANSEDDLILLAQAALMTGQASQALRLTERLRGTEVDQIRARANEIQFDYAQAIAALGSTSDTAELESLAWRGGDWTRLANGGDTAKARAAKFVQKETARKQNGLGTTTPKDEGSGAATKVLASARSKIESSREARELLSDLLGLP